MCFRKKQKNRAGFSYIEILVAAAIMSIGMLALVELMVKGVSVSIESRDEIIAAQLAQEGTELIRSIRDNNAIDGQDSFLGIPAGDTCADILSDTVGDPVLASPCGSYALGIETAMGGLEYYAHDGAGSSHFSRIIIISDNAAGDEYTIRSQVVWNRTDFPAVCVSSEQCVEARSVLTRWLE